MAKTLKNKPATFAAERPGYVTDAAALGADDLYGLLPKEGITIGNRYSGTIKNGGAPAKSIEFELTTTERGYLIENAKNLALSNHDFGANVERHIAGIITEKFKMIAVEAHCGTNCIDLLLVDDLTNPTRVLVFEIKGTRATSGQTWTFGTRGDFVQMTDDWLRSVMMDNGLGADARRVLQKWENKELPLEKYGIFVDGNGAMNILKLE